MKKNVFQEINYIIRFISSSLLSRVGYTKIPKWIEPSTILAQVRRGADSGMF